MHPQTVCKELQKASMCSSQCEAKTEDHSENKGPDGAPTSFLGQGAEETSSPDVCVSCFPQKVFFRVFIM